MSDEEELAAWCEREWPTIGQDTVSATAFVTSVRERYERWKEEEGR